MSNTDMFILMQPVDNKLGDAGLVFAGLQEGSHKFSNEVKEKAVGGKMDHDFGVSSEEIDITLDRIKNDPGQEQLIDAFRKKKEVKVWIGYKAIVKNPETQAEEHDANFGYTIPEEIEDSFDDESASLEATLKVKVETVPMKLPKLPDSVLNPSSASIAVTPENPGEYTGPLSSRTKTASA